MGLFTNKYDDNYFDDQFNLLQGQLEELAGSVARLKGEESALAGAREAQARITTLQRQLSALEIDKAKVEEANARDKRETEHMVGLERKRQEQDAAHQTRQIELAKQEAVLSVREENLTVDRERFESQMTFIQERMTGEVESMRNLVTEMLARLPEVSVEKRIEIGTSPAAVD